MKLSRLFLYTFVKRKISGSYGLLCPCVWIGTVLAIVMFVFHFVFLFRCTFNLHWRLLAEQVGRKRQLHQYNTNKLETMVLLRSAEPRPMPRRGRSVNDCIHPLLRRILSHRSRTKTAWHPKRARPRQIPKQVNSIQLKYLVILLGVFVVELDDHLSNIGWPHTSLEKGLH